MDQNQPLFLNKYQPFFFKDFETDPEMVSILNTLINMNNYLLVILVAAKLLS